MILWKLLTALWHFREGNGNRGKRGENREGEAVKAIAKVCFLFPTQNECVQIDRVRGREIQGAAEERLRY